MPVENPFGYMKALMRSYYKPHNKETLEASIKDYFANRCTKGLCRIWIRRMYRVMDLVIARGGHPVRGRFDDESPEEVYTGMEREDDAEADEEDAQAAAERDASAD